MKIERVTATWLRCPLERERQHVSDFGRQLTFDTTIVRIDTDDGRVGWGEAKSAVGSAANCAAVQACIEQELAAIVIGRDPGRIRELWERMYCGVRGELALARGRSMPDLGRRGVRICAMSGVDMALWDLLGKSLEVPIVQLLGGVCHDALPAYASGGWACAAEIGAELGGYVAAGFNAVKMRVGAMDGDVAHSIARVQAARSALGPDIAIMCDAHGSMSSSEARRFCRGVEDAGIRWFEEPCSNDDLQSLAEVRQVAPMPIALGESLTTRFEVRDAIRARAVDVVQPDAAIIGGISEMTRVAHLCETYHLEFAPHLWGSALTFSAGMHVAFATPCARVLEYSLGGNPLLREMVADPPTPVEGLIAAPQAAGLGVEPDEAFIAQYACSVPS